MKTRAGVYYDLTKSEYRATLDGNTFVFSSQLHKEKFLSRYRRNRESINDSLTRRFNVDIAVPALADAVLYSKIENRGFLIVTQKGSITCRNSITFDGVNLTVRS